MEKKISKAEIALIGFDVVAGAGVDVILTGIAKAAVPASYGLPGLIQKICIKTATVSLSFIAAEMLDRTLRKYAKEFADSVREELDRGMNTK